MTYGKNAKVGNITVFSREGAIEAYRTFCRLFNKELSLEASIAQDNAARDMLALCFTTNEIETIEISTL